MTVLETYQPFKVLIPDWFCTRDESIVYETNRLMWNILKLMSFRYTVNPFHPHLLIQKNRWTRPWHFEQDYFREPSGNEVWGSMMTTLQGIAYKN